MSQTMRIYCVNAGRYVDIRGGETLSEVFASLRSDPATAALLPARPVCARVNNKTEDLSFPVFAPKMVEYLDRTSATGRRVYVRSLCMMLYRALTDVLPGVRLRIEHSVARGYYCRLSDGRDGRPVTVDAALTDALLERMRALSRAALPFVRKERLTRDVSRMFAAQGLDDKVLLLDTLHELYTTFYRLDGVNDSYYGPLAPSTDLIDVFGLCPYKEGFLLLGPGPDGEHAAEPVAQEKMYRAFTDYLRFNRVIRVSNAGELNRAVRDRQASDLINIAEAMHERLAVRISDTIAARRREGGARIVLIAGPSSSGKTTSTKRLAIQLMTNLITPKMISLDDYFVDREATPLDADGEYDYENLHALDLDRLNSDLSRLLAGERINLPTYSFELGRRVERERPLSLDADDVLLIEGIHGLNPELTAGLDADDLFKVYVSALTTLSIDDHNWISTTDNRLLRRIVRDHKYRHTPALDTLRRWPSVRRGEERWIFPYQENADAMFNSSLIFEIGVMKEYAMPLLRGVPRDVPEYAEAFRLMRLLDYFEPIPVDQIPATSLLREFLGGSSFRY